MQILAVNENNDLYVVNGRILVKKDLEGVLQACEHAAKTRLSEVVLNINEGVPYFETIWNGVPIYQQFDAALRVAFLGVPDVVEVISLLLTKDSDNLLYSAVIRTIYGAGEING